MRPIRRRGLQSRIEAVEQKALERPCPECQRREAELRRRGFTEERRLAAIAALSGLSTEPEPEYCNRCGRLTSDSQIGIRLVDELAEQGLVYGVTYRYVKDAKGDLH